MKLKFNNYNRYLVIGPDSIADVLMTLPLTQTIKNHNKLAEISYITTPQSSMVVYPADSVDKVILNKKASRLRDFGYLKEITGLVREQRPDCIITPIGPSRSDLLIYLPKTKASIDFDKNLFLYLVKSRIKNLKNTRGEDRNLSLVDVFSTVDENLCRDLSEVDYSVSDEDKFFIHSKLSMYGIYPKNGIVLIAPDINNNPKKWPEERFKESVYSLLNKGFKCILIGSNNDYEHCLKLATIANIPSLAGETSIAQCVYLMTQSKCLVIKSTTAKHMAELAGCPTVEINQSNSLIFDIAKDGPVPECN